VDVVGIKGGSLLVLMIEPPPTYICNAIQNLRQWLQVIRMQPHTCNGKDYGLCVSYPSTNHDEHTIMTVEGTDHFRLDLTLLLLYRRYLITFYYGQMSYGSITTPIPTPLSTVEPCK